MRPLLLSLPATLVATLGLAAADAPEGAPQALLVATRTLEARPYLVTLPGKVGVLEAAQTLAVSFEVAGRIERIRGEGARVELGEEIASLGTRLEEAELQKAELALADARAERKRVEGLERSRAVSVKALDRARTDEGLRRAEREAAAERLARRSLSARFSGVIADVHFDPGEVVTPGATVATLIDFDMMLLRLGLPGHQVVRVLPGAAAVVEVPDLESENGALAGVIHHVEPATAAGAHLFEAEVLVPNADHRLRPGMNARARIIVDELPAARIAPLESVVHRGGERVIFFADEGVAHRVALPEGSIHGDDVVVPAGVPWRELVLHGQHDLVDGVPVRVDSSVLAGAQR